MKAIATIPVLKSSVQLASTKSNSQIPSMLTRVALKVLSILIRVQDETGGYFNTGASLRIGGHFTN